jgi:4-amino-4-deoxy-L-arabinose transferase-like glycosyltransferase
LSEPELKPERFRCNLESPEKTCADCFWKPHLLRLQLRNNTFVETLGKSRLLLIAIAVAALAPFLNKAVHVDDPLFLWMADQIIKHPLDPYGFNVNWSSFVQPMSVVMQNPPLCSYYIAAVARVFGWSEPILHLAFLFWAVLAILGTFALARRFCRDALLAALLTIFTPAFLVSATSMMCDVMMFAFWIWALEFWLSGLDRQQWWRFLVSAMLITAAALTKYFGIALVPLLVVYMLVRDRRRAMNLASLLIPLAVLSNYEFVTEEKYGRGLLTAAMNVSSSVSSATRPSHVAQLLMGLAFCGGCFIGTLFFTRLRTRIVLLGTALAVIVFAVAFKFLIVSWVYLESSEAPVWLEGGLFATVGAGILTCAVVNFVRKKSPDALLLLLWIVGTFAFATFFNWSVTGRTFLPMAPAVSILTIQYWEERQTRSRSKYAALLATLLLSMLIAVADYRQAECGRCAARSYRDRYLAEANKIRFLGHWGFQYYMQQWGATPFDRNRPKIDRGETVVGPFSDLNVKTVQVDQVSMRHESTFSSFPLISTSSLGSGASFYSSFGGPLPWVINKIPPDRYYTITAK